ncbi:MAG: nucleotidyl transferase AbiEii/AbiGii toxin family protein [Verrucomicrobia bacterium]|nr:nucleotidyl transferase AbiEii/AbiGii toxin family protein [Verrucomicrobiota bacterium]
MSKTVRRNLPASVRQRLLNLSRDRQEPFNATLVRYAIECLFYRLSVSPYADRFLLKGAMLFATWSETLHRPTQDVDALGYGDPDAGEPISKVLPILHLPASRLPESLLGSQVPGQRYTWQTV